MIHKLNNYFNNHFQALFSSCRKLTHSPFTTLMTLIVIGIALTLPLSGFILLQNIKSLSENWNNKNSQVTIYLTSQISESQLQHTIQILKTNSTVEKLQYISPQQGLDEFQQQTDVHNSLEVLNQNPLPGVILLQPNVRSPQQLKQLIQTIKALPGIDTVQLDMQWVEKLYSFITIIKNITYLVGLLLGTGILIIVAHTIHLALQKYHHEIKIFQLIGATHGFIKRPFIYTGILYGFLGSIIALMLLFFLYLEINSSVLKLSALYNSDFHLQMLKSDEILLLFIVGMGLGWLGAWLATTKFLRN